MTKDHECNHDYAWIPEVKDSFNGYWKCNWCNHKKKHDWKYDYVTDRVIRN